MPDKDLFISANFSVDLWEYLLSSLVVDGISEHTFDSPRWPEVITRSMVITLSVLSCLPFASFTWCVPEGWINKVWGWVIHGANPLAFRSRIRAITRCHWLLLWLWFLQKTSSPFLETRPWSLSPVSLERPWLSEMKKESPAVANKIRNWYPFCSHRRMLPWLTQCLTNW